MQQGGSATSASALSSPTARRECSRAQPRALRCGRWVHAGAGRLLLGGAHPPLKAAASLAQPHTLRCRLLLGQLWLAPAAIVLLGPAAHPELRRRADARVSPVWLTASAKGMPHDSDKGHSGSWG